MGESCEVLVVGAGLVGLATARALVARGVPGRDLVLLEAEARVAAHQSGHNSGVVHAGLYYRPGSLKARLCASGRAALVRYCEERALPLSVCGKLVVAVEEAELAPLAELERRGRANGLTGLERLDPRGLQEREPGARGVAGLWVPQTAVVDFRAVAARLARELREAGVRVELGRALRGVERDPDGWRAFAAGAEVRARRLVNCAGLHADRVARLAGSEPDVRIVPFRGEYWRLRPERRGLVRGLVYPVPDPRFPFLGAHFTRGIDGQVEAGPNAVLALSRHGYSRADVDLRDLREMLTWPGLWRLGLRHAGTAAAEVARSLSRALFARALRRLIPAVRAADLLPGGAGVRAQALGRDGRLLDDFHFAESERALHVLCAPSPAATACLAIGEHIAARTSA